MKNLKIQAHTTLRHSPRFTGILLIFMVIFVQGCKTGLLTAPADATLQVSVNPVFIPVGGTSTIKVIGYKASGTPLPDGTLIFFSCDYGIIDAQAETENGVAYATFKSNSNRSGTANITVSSGHATVSPESVTITIGISAPDSILLSAAPQVLPAGGGASRIYITAFDENLNPAPDVPIILTTDAGQLDSGGKVLYTSASGKAEDVLVTSDTANVTAAAGVISAQVTIIVEDNERPTASFVYSPSTPVIEQWIYFNASGSFDPDGTIMSYQWDFGNGKSAYGRKVKHRYFYPGTYTVLLVVIDDNGAQAGTSSTLTVANIPISSRMPIDGKSVQTGYRIEKRKIQKEKLVHHD